ncbi:uncharacterized protein LOC9641455 isoform X3 [Selaginella moellendorffii]|uniref:uncharacterized protein LOC9641455 isoform X3 n=1 Tax=Selaginella moellendorffii TaxID=88036 RepID=UPI000D1C754C|nr:uncharacterized protein LOC9641455 isoform X3 [Selaginella moellendorffii]|eukprot:XP_024515733.1 uncharacterized protein LOC9641455 isoform X3 [Selaginella moellendorffii]
MALQRSRDRGSYRMYPPPPPSVPPILAAGSPAAPPHIPMPPSFQYHHHQHQQQPQQQPPRQNHHQVQASPHPHSYHQPREVLLHGGGAAGVPAVLDLAMAAYRQRAVPAPPPQSSHGILAPQQQRLQPSPGWDERNFRNHHLLPPMPHQGPEMRIDSSVVLDGRFPPDSRLAPSSANYRPHASMADSPHDRNVYWQPPPSNLYSAEVMVPRAYQRRTPSPLRGSDRRFVEVESGHLASRSMVSSPRPHYDREVRNRSRERSPARYQRASRVVERSSPLPARQSYEGRRHYHREDDDREDGQLTPEDNIRRKVYGRNSITKYHDHSHSTSDSHGRNQRVHSQQKRERPACKELGSPVKKSRFDVRPPLVEMPGETSVKKLTVTGHKQAPKDHPARDSRSPQRTPKEKERAPSPVPKLHTVGKSSSAKASIPTPTHPQPSSSQVQKKLKEIPEKTLLANTTEAPTDPEPQEQAAVALEPRQAKHFEAVTENGQAKEADVDIPVAAVVENGEHVDSVLGTSLVLADGTEKPTSLELAQVPERAAREEQHTTAPAASTIQALVDHSQKVMSSSDERKHGSKQAVLSIRKNPSMPVAFKPRTTATSKTWHRDGNAPGTSKLSNVFTAGKSGEASTLSTAPSYVRKGNSLVRTSPVLPKYTGSPLRTAVMKKPTVRKSPILAAGPLSSGDQNQQGKANATLDSSKAPVEIIDLDPEVPSSTALDSSKNSSGVGELDKQNSVPGENSGTIRSKTSPLVVSPSGEHDHCKPDVYVKRKTNQLVRNTESSRKREQSSEDLPVMKTKLGKALRLKKNSSSWVWTPSDTHKAPHLMPWKKRLYRRVRTRRLEVLPKGKKGSLLSLISEKLRVLRTSQPLYTRSANGFSLHRSGVRSVDGASLKWTKSLEKRSRQANQDATKAVAALEKHCRKKTDKGGVKAGTSRERIVLVGLVRYKMDPSKRTLQRIQESSENSNVSSSSTGAWGLLTPRRASIGGAVYVRMGNGNQLVRDPKASSRALASEKVRWSLHNIRSRVIKKQQYCQFFTRFGKCKKGDGKCPYIHDAGKVAVCTKFLKGSCSNVSCLLTHKVLPERMPDCSFFLQGLCINEECPYRHVNVNPDAPVCEGFLKGYCASGDQCNKKHTYVCPAYAATGECPERAACKLHHPNKKERTREVSTKASTKGEKKRRYFVGSEIPPRPLAMGSSSQDVPGNIDAGVEFISLEGISLDGVERDTDSGDSRKPRVREDGLLWFNDMSEEEVERLIKPAFVWQSRELLQV